MRRALLVGIFWLLTAPAHAATPGFVEDFSAGTATFAGGSPVNWVTSGGVGGASDPYISISNSIPTNLGSHSTDPNMIGNLTTAGVTGYSFWLRDTGANDNHEIHVGIGIPNSNFWLSIPGFTPPDGAWKKFSVNLSDASQWVRIIGTGTFAAAKASSGRLLFRHDLAPFVQNPDDATGDFGLDRITVLPAAPAVPALSTAGWIALGAALCAAAAARFRRAAR